MNKLTSSLQSKVVPKRETWLPYGRQWIDEADIQAVIAVLQSDYLTTGPQIEHFERKLAKKVGASYAVAFSNGTAALHAACYAAGINAGDEVITTPLTFAASANCVLYQQGIPVFADIDEKTYNIDPTQAASLITSKTKAIIPVDFTGQPADLNEIMKLAKQHGLVVIEDAAHALGASYDGQPIGSISDMTMFSLHPVKQITSGEGGVITTNNPMYYDKLLQFRSHGIIRDPARWSNESSPVGWYYEMQSLGFNYRITDMQAALASSQLDKLDLFVDRRKEYAARYDKAFSQIPYIITPFQKGSRQSSWHLYVIQLELEWLIADRNQIYNELIAENIGVQVHYIPVYLHPYYQQLGYAKGQCLQAEKLYDRILTLPLFPSMTHEDVQDVIDAVLRVIGKYVC
jgi:UDP-4-amino-4,6-dideoxy-N-acetyl-beta-L-altrosamine transaminase